MSKTTKVKHVTRELMEEFVTPNEDQQIVQVVAGRGNNLHEVRTANGEAFLASMPNKFRKNVWIKRGDYVVISPISEGDRVKAEIIHILYKHHIRHLRQTGSWPKEFGNVRFNSKDTKALPLAKESNDLGDSDGGNDSGNDDDLFVNTNRRYVTYQESSDDSSEDEAISEVKSV